ncbi:MAG TPA: FtsX-like permease family protein [Trueperaceae bacterium]
MTALLRLAWRSLWRQRRRTLLLIVVVAYATTAIVFFWAFTDGFLSSVFAGQARLLRAPVVISTEEYFADRDPVNALPGLDPIVSALGEFAYRAAPRLEVAALLRSPYSSEGALIRGVDPGLEGRVSALPAQVEDGRMLESQGEVVLGADLAERLDVRIGERLAVDVSSAAGPQASGLEVVGLIDSGVTLVDETTVLTHIEDARALSGIDTATEIAVAAPLGREDEVADRLDPLLPEGIEAYGVKEMMGELAAGLATERRSMIPLGLLFSIFAAIAVTSSVVVSVMERTREFGVMIALGLDQARLSWMVTLEAILATLIGYAVGLVLGYGLITWMAYVNVLGSVFASAWGDIFSGLTIGNDIRTDIRIEYLLYAGVTVAFAALFAVLTPARRVRNLAPSEAMRTAA